MFTLQALLLFRTSGAGMARNSAFGAFGGAEKMKDPRPLHDKAYVQQCIRQLCEVWIPNIRTLKYLRVGVLL